MNWVLKFKTDKMTMKRGEIHARIFLTGCLSLVFFIPVYPRVLPPIIILLILNWIIEGRYRETVPKLFRERQRTWMISHSLIYLAYIVGLLWTKNFTYGTYDLEIKLSLLIFPVIFATSGGPAMKEREFGLIIRIFGLGCLAGSLILLGRASYNSMVNQIPDAFSYTGLSWNFHPSYLAMYLTFTVSNIIYLLLMKQTTFSILKKSVYVFLLVYFVIFIVLLSSKAGLLSLFIIVLVYSALLWWRFKRRVKAILMLFIACLVISGGLLLFPKASMRISQAGKELHLTASEQSSGSSTHERIVIWKSSLDIISAHPLFGVGTGDVKDELLKKYNENNIQSAFEQKLNSHNQYFQTFIALGLAGFLILVSLLFCPAWLSFRQGDYIYFFFLLVFGINIFVESMLEIQQGIIFYSFFNSFLFWSMINGKVSINKKSLQE
jgi:O-antigen ligase